MWSILTFSDIYVELMKRRELLAAHGLRAEMEWTAHYPQDVVTISREVSGGRRYLFRIEREAWQRGELFALGRAGDSYWYPFRVNPVDGQPLSMAPHSWMIPPEDLQQFAQGVYGLLAEIRQQMIQSYSQLVQATWRSA